MTLTRPQMRERLEALAETVIALLDEIDGEPDLEDGDPDREDDDPAELAGDETDASFPEGGRGAVAMGYDLHEDSEEDDPPEDDDADSCVCDGPHDGEEGL